MANGRAITRGSVMPSTTPCSDWSNASIVRAMLRSSARTRLVLVRSALFHASSRSVQMLRAKSPPMPKDSSRASKIRREVAGRRTNSDGTRFLQL